MTQISDLHKKSLNSLDGGSHEEAGQLDTLVSETRNITNDVKSRIQALEAVKATGTEGRIRRDQVTQLFTAMGPSDNRHHL